MSATATRLARGAGWTLIGAGVVVLLYLVYSLLYTNVTTVRAQAALSEEWDLAVGDVSGRLADEGNGRRGKRGRPAAQPVTATTGDAVAVLEFSRPGSVQPPVHAGPLYVVQGVGLEQLARGPGHYPGTAAPGAPGNFAVAGHRTTYGAPFFNLDDLQPGDRVKVTDRAGDRYVYKVRRQTIVAPTDNWVIGPDPLEGGKPTLTLTTCNPRFSNRERLIVFAELVS